MWGIRPALTYQILRVGTNFLGFRPSLYIKHGPPTNISLYSRCFGTESTLLNRYATPGRVSSCVGSSRPCDRARRRYCALFSKSARVTLTQACLHSVIHELYETHRVGQESNPRPGFQASGNSIGSVLLHSHSFDLASGQATRSPASIPLIGPDPIQAALPPAADEQGSHTGARGIRWIRTLAKILWAGTLSIVDLSGLDTEALTAHVVGRQAQPYRRSMRNASDFPQSVSFV